jgi:predicted acyl esterase
MTYRIDNIDVLQTSPGSAFQSEAKWVGLNSGREILQKGYRKSPGHRAFAADTVWERDIAIPLRDGTVIRADVFRPLNMEGTRISTLVVWSPYGKTGTGEPPFPHHGPMGGFCSKNMGHDYVQADTPTKLFIGLFSLDLIPGRVGVPQKKLSGFESFEAPDPAVWTARGYAIVNVDARGVMGSDGDVRYVFYLSSFNSGLGRISSLLFLAFSCGPTCYVIQVFFSG